MARWSLKSEHYLNLVPSDEWEYKETDQLTGRTARTVCKVPTYLDPRKQAITVAYKGSALPGDLIFDSEPTPEMEPLDDEAAAINAKLQPKWDKHPIESLPGTTMAEAVVEGLQKAIADLAVSQKMPAPPKAIDPAEFAALQMQVKELMERNAALQKQTQPIARRA